MLTQIRFAEHDERLFARECAELSASDALLTLECDDETETALEHMRALDAIDRRRDTAIALEEFCLNARYEARVRAGVVVVR